MTEQELEHYKIVAMFLPWEGKISYYKGIEVCAHGDMTITSLAKNPIWNNYAHVYGEALNLKTWHTLPELLWEIDNLTDNN